MYKMIALDLDGTLLNSNHQISTNNINMLKKCIKNDIKIVLASGRSDISITPYIKKLSLDEYFHVGNSGGTIFNLNGEKINVSAFSKEVYKHIITNLKKHELEFLCCSSSGMFYEKSDTLVKNLSDMKEAKAQKMNSVECLKDIFKVVTIVKDKCDEEKILSIKHPEIYTFYTTDVNMEIMSKDVNKFNGIKNIADQYGIKKEEILAIGDNENDIDMIRQVGFGIAMKDAKPKLKEVADQISEWDNNEDGVAKLINKFVFENIS